MTTDQIFKLIDAGFTKDDIMSLTEKTPEPEPVSEPEPEPISEPEKTEEPKAPENSSPDMFKFIAEEFSKMTKTIQESNILNSNIKTKESVPVEEMLADIIRPDEALKRKEK